MVVVVIIVIVTVGVCCCCSCLLVAGCGLLAVGCWLCLLFDCCVWYLLIGVRCLLILLLPVDVVVVVAIAGVIVH